MSAIHRRAARREQQLADLLGTTRTKHRNRYTRAPDVAPVKLPNGFVVQGESKSRKRLPKWLYDAIDQAEGYTPHAIAVVSLSQRGSSEPLALLRLRDLCLLLGLQLPSAGEQLALARQP